MELMKSYVTKNETKVEQTKLLDLIYWASLYTFIDTK